MLRRTFTTLLLLATVACQQMPQPEALDGVLILGGTRGVGLETVKLLERKGTPVTVLVRETSDTAALAATRAELVVGDAMDRASIAAAVESRSISVVISTLAGKSRDGQMVDAVGNINGIDVAVASGIQRFILISSIGVGDSKVAMPAPVRKVLSEFLRGKEQAEAALIQSGLDYTIIRPGNLTNEPATQTGILTEDRTVTGKISRAEVARLIVDALNRPDSIGKIYAAVDAN